MLWRASGVRRGELFALRWRHVDEGARVLRIREAVYEGVFDTPKTDASQRDVPLGDGALQLLAEWKQHVRTIEADGLVFPTRSGKPISPNNVLRRWVFPACTALGLRTRRLHRGSLRAILSFVFIHLLQDLE